MDRTDPKNPACGCAENFTRDVGGSGLCEANAVGDRCDPNGVGNGKVTNVGDPEGPCVCPENHFLDGEAPNDKCVASPVCGVVSGLKLNERGDACVCMPGYNQLTPSDTTKEPTLCLIDCTNPSLYSGAGWKEDANQETGE